MNLEKLTITLILTQLERTAVGELLTHLKTELARVLDMLQEAVETGESTSDNPNIAEHMRVLGYLKPLLNKIAAGRGELALSAIEAAQLEKLLADARDFRDYLEFECENRDEEGLSTEARQYQDLNDILTMLRPLRNRLLAADLEWPKPYQD